MSQRAISHAQGKGSLRHNNREFQPKNADPERKADNVTLIQQDIGEAYRHLFGGAVDEYNARQTRKDRRIDDYYISLFGRKPCGEVLTGSNKQKSFYEDIVQIGDMKDTPVGSEASEIAKQCLIEYIEGWSVRNPNFYLFNAVVHMDEATPHLHIDYIPIGHYNRGLSVQNGLAQALKEMGYGTGKDAISRWRKAERDVFADICRSHGFEIAPEQEGRGHTYTVDEYKELQEVKRETAELHAYIEAHQSVYDSRRELEGIKASTVTKKPVWSKSESVTRSKADDDRLIALAERCAIAEKRVDELTAENDYLKRENARLNKRITELVREKQALERKVDRLEWERAQSDRLYNRHKSVWDMLRDWITRKPDYEQAFLDDMCRKFNMVFDDLSDFNDWYNDELERVETELTAAKNKAAGRSKTRTLQIDR